MLHGGAGSDGALDTASMYDPLFVTSVHDTILFADGCALRQISDGRVRTLLGEPAECVAPQNETLEPVPWASRLSKPEALAGAAEETLDGTVLALTGSEVLRVRQGEDECERHADAEECSAQPGCGWAEGVRPHERRCFGCDNLHEWAAGLATAMDPCLLETSPRGSTSYRLESCGCVAPQPAPSPEPDSGDDTGLTVLQVIFGGSVIIAACCCMLMFRRASRREAAMRELYGVDTAEFHIFTDDEP